MYAYNRWDLSGNDKSVASLPYERRLVNEFLWSDRSSDSFCCIAESKLYICHSVHGNIPGEEAEEELAVPSNALLSSFEYDLNDAPCICFSNL
jgi:hypothetical protein